MILMQSTGQLTNELYSPLARARAGGFVGSTDFQEATSRDETAFEVRFTWGNTGDSETHVINFDHEYHRNQQYSVTAITNSSAGIVERYAYQAYGEPTILDASASALSSSSINNRFTYTGREWDGTIGLYHFRARWMSGLTGRFLSRDPIGYWGGTNNLYEYVGANPFNAVDPSGLVMFYEPPSSWNPYHNTPDRGFPRWIPPEPSEEEYAKSKCYCDCASVVNVLQVVFQDPAGTIRNRAETWADRFFPRMSRENSALRHCFAGGMLATRLGCKCAQCLEDNRDVAQYFKGVMHPGPGVQGWDNTQQAIYNDRAGRQCATCSGTDARGPLTTAVSDTQISQCCMTRFRAGQLYTGNPATGIPPFPIYPSIWPRVPQENWWNQPAPVVEWEPPKSWYSW
jgi:RHS repeat-associated protein